jgi:hypothetical protein
MAQANDHTLKTSAALGFRDALQAFEQPRVVSRVRYLAAGAANASVAR